MRKFGVGITETKQKGKWLKNTTCIEGEENNRSIENSIITVNTKFKHKYSRVLTVGARNSLPSDEQKQMQNNKDIEVKRKQKSEVTRYLLIMKLKGKSGGKIDKR